MQTTELPSILRALVDLQERQIQKNRIAFNNRKAAIINEADNPSRTNQLAIVDRWLGVFEEIETMLQKDINNVVKDYKMYEYITAVKGVGPAISAKLISMIDINRSNTVSQLWRYCGLAVFDGKAERRVKGQKLGYNNRLKATCLFLLSRGLLTAKGPYYDVYLDARSYYELNRPDWSEAHQHRAAVRKMVKLFLSHMWETWRRVEGLSVRPIYAQEYLNHSTISNPVEFGWPEP